MDAPRNCAQCGAVLSVYALEGVCGNCLLKPALEPMPEALSEPANQAHFPRSGTEKGSRFEDYELLEEIARGGMGIVYRARQVSLDRIVAVKMLLAGHLAGKDFVQRFRTEAAAAASLQHANIVAIHEVGFAEGQHFFAMDYVEGWTLAQIVANGPLPAGQAATYLKAIAEAIHFAHERNVLHRDLKPSNVLIDSATDQPRVTDFGLAKRLEGETELTLSGQLLGSPNYVSPEQAAAKRGTVGKRSDVYSLGAILYHLLTGRPPFQGETLTDVLRQLAEDDPLAPRLLTPSVPPDLETICLKCLQKEPSRRYQTAQELGDELGRFLEHKPIHARPVSRGERAWRWCRRKPALAGSIATAVALLLVVAIGSPIAAFRVERERQRAEKNAAALSILIERVEQNLYDADMSLAPHAWAEGDIGRTLNLLEAHRPKGAEKDRRGFEWFYFWNLCTGEQRITLSGHSNAVNCVAFSPDGRRVATGAFGNPVHVWDTATGSLVNTVPEQAVVSLAFAPGGKALAVGGRDQLVMWDLETERAVFREEEALGLFRVAFSPIGTLLVIGKHGGQWTEDGGGAELRDYATRESKHAFPEAGGRIALSGDGRRLATANSGQTTRIWDLTSGEFIGSPETNGVMALALSPNGHTLATSEYWNSRVRLWDTSKGQPMRWLTNYEHRVWALAFSPDGKFLATGGADHTLRLWDVATLQQAELFLGHSGEVKSVAFSADGHMLASGSDDKTAMLWSTQPNRTETTVSNVVSRPIFSVDGQFIAAGIGQDTVALWDAATLRVRKVFPGAREAIAFSSGGTLVTRGANYSLRVFDVARQAILETIPRGFSDNADSYAALSPDGEILATCSTDGRISFSNARTGGAVANVASGYGSLFPFNFSPNGKLLATTGIKKAKNDPAPAIIRAVAKGEQVAALAGETGGVVSTAFSPDSKILATSATDDSVRFWDTTTWKELLPSLAQKEYVSSVAFSPDGRTLATACSDGTLKLWNVATRRELASLRLGMYGFSITFSPDGQTLAAWNPWDGGLLRLWRAPIPKPYL